MDKINIITVSNITCIILFRIMHFKITCLLNPGQNENGLKIYSSLMLIKLIFGKQGKLKLYFTRVRYRPMKIIQYLMLVGQ